MRTLYDNRTNVLFAVSIMPRLIAHIDLNNFYASVEVLHHPKLRGHPVAVGGDAEQRHGIILAKNYEAKKYDIQVGMALWQARQRCPNLIIVPPSYDLYFRFSSMLRAILYDYTDLVEPFGLDEAWIDVTHSPRSIGGVELADEIRERIKFEMGVTASAGVSYNKIFAKLGSDYKKPDATTVITLDNYQDIVWPLPVEDILGVGRATAAKLQGKGIHTIGALAQTDPRLLQQWLGKWGLILHSFSNGLDSSPVARFGSESVIKSVGNSTTAPRDLEDEHDCKIVFYNLAESVAERLRELGMKSRTVQVSLRDNELNWIERQMTLPASTYLASELSACAMILLNRHYQFQKPLRSIGIHATNLEPDCAAQCSLFADEAQRQKKEILEKTIDVIRRRFGHHSIVPALMKFDNRLGKLDAKTDHIIHPVGYF